MIEISPEITNYIITFVGIFLGVFLRTILPYLQKLNENPGMIFQWRYVATAFISGFGTTTGLILIFDIPETSLVQLFMMAVAFSYFGEDLLNSIMKAKGTKTIKVATKQERIEAKIKKLQQDLEKEKIIKT